MQLTVLGGAAACPNPGQGSSAYLVEHDGTRLLLDCGPDTLSVLRAHTDFRAIDAVVISHIHSDHTIDLVPYRYGLKYGPGRVDRRIPLWLPPGGLDFLDRLAAAFAAGDEPPSPFFSEVFAAEEYDPAAARTLGPFTVRFQATRHYVPCWAIRVEAAGKALVYSADTGPSGDVVAFARDADLFVCEGTWLAGMVDVSDAKAGHLTAAKAGEMAAEAGAGRLLLTHMWEELGFERYREEAQRAFGHRVELARPGLVVEV